MVLFFAKSGKPVIAPEKLEGLAASDKLGEAVSHMGIVIDVIKLEPGAGTRGQLTQAYMLFHGRRSGTTACITTWHYRTPRSAPMYPFGNGKQQLIGAAPFSGSLPPDFDLVKPSRGPVSACKNRGSGSCKAPL